MSVSRRGLFDQHISSDCAGLREGNAQSENPRSFLVQGPSDNSDIINMIFIPFYYFINVWNILDSYIYLQEL